MPGPRVERVALVMAMRAEGLPVVERLGLVEVPGPAPLTVRWFDGEVAGAAVRVALNGVDRRHGVDAIATQPATLTTYVTAVDFAPDLIVTAGTAGGWLSRGAEIGDVVVSTAPLVFHDRRVPLDGFVEYGHGRYPVAEVAGLARRLGARAGVVSTSNSLDAPEHDVRLMSDHGADAKEMEAAAVGWVAEQLGIPVVAVKAITDHVDHHVDTAEQFTANLERATAALVDALEALVHDAAGRPLSHLAD